MGYSLGVAWSLPGIIPLFWVLGSCSGGVLWLVASIDSLLPQHSSIGGVGKGHSITGKDVDATHYASYEFKVEGLPDSPVFPPDSSVG